MQSKTAIFILSIISVFIVVMFVSFFFIQKNNMEQATKQVLQQNVQKPGPATKEREELPDGRKKYTLEEIDAYVNPHYTPQQLEQMRRKYLTEKYGAEKAELILQSYKEKVYYR